MKTILQTLCITLLLLVYTNSGAQTPALSSNPAAQAVIFLDFDGHYLAGTSWNWNGDIDCGASGLTNEKITEVFDRVAEDYRPFNINITTDSTKFNAAPLGKRMRVIVTTTSSWYGSAGGVAFVGSYSWGDDSPCFVFSALLNYNVKNVSEAVSHEAGHTLGLYHQSKYDNTTCSKISDYYSGQGTGEIGWAPIMGVGYYQNFTLWNNGPNSLGCTNYQSDLDIITSANNGFGYRTDDHGTTFATATQPTFSSDQFTAKGIIERNTDQDMFKFIMPSTGRFQLDAIPYNVGSNNAGSNLDMQVTIYNEAETVLSVYNPNTLLSSLADTTLNAGTYYLKVEGKGNLYAPSYASLGSYSLQGRINNSGEPLPLHKLELKVTQQADQHQLNWVVEADEKVLQQFVEVSTDGKNFSTLAEVKADSRSYLYKPGTNPTYQYRVHVLFDNGRRYYSNIAIAILRENNTSQRPKLVSNLISTNEVYVNSPGNFSYTVLDFNGRMVSKGQLLNGINQISIHRMIAGMYIIHFAGNNQQWTDKLLRQ